MSEVKSELFSEEEKKAINSFKSYINAIDTFGTIDKKCCNNLYEPAQVVLDLLEKLQKEKETYRNDIYGTRLVLKERDKEIEELRKKLSLKCFDVNVVYNDYLEKLRELKSNSIPKDKIIERITYLIGENEVADMPEECVNRNEYLIRTLQELLEEE